jgi:short-subunit dehydrogenase
MRASGPGAGWRCEYRRVSRPPAGGGAYSASKAAAISYLESLRVKLHGSRVSVITVCPGFIITPMTAEKRYRMPFVMKAEDAAAKIACIVEENNCSA